MVEGGEYDGSREEEEGSGILHGEQWSIELRSELALAIRRSSCWLMKDLKIKCVGATEL